MELKLELSSARNWLSGFKGFHTDHQYNCEKGKSPLTKSEFVSSKTSTRNELPVKFSRSKACGDTTRGNKAVLRGSEVEELNERLKILEEETEIIKDAFFWSLEERKHMMNEIYQQFQLLNRGLQTGNLVLGESSGVYPFEDRKFRKSLLEILGRDPNPCLLTRELKANFLELQEPAKNRGHMKFHHD
ncbi:hypothetical protein TorRG33x02_140860 [Trema orientale]|uniref:Uncharacterized protein n=1 Tax=Trema orientale TaxID=63057 RepID=A0A2P5EWY3_TREOI|nr:hypothetical protein TorRG33x02_140860 [Trema orientale]